MEHCKVIFSDKNVRRQSTIMVLLLLAMLLIGQLIAAHMAEDFKTAMIEHDYAVAGHLQRSGVDNDQIVAAFASDKDDADTEAGASMLSVSGYDKNTNDSLLPMVGKLHQKYSAALFTLSLPFSILFLFVLCIGAIRHDRRLEAAACKLRHFMDGDTDVRLEDCGEGSLSRLFASVNTMATSLTAHIEMERQNKEFLKDTISDISHQLKTPLAALSMYNEIISDEKTGNEVIESFAEKNRREIDRMENLIQSLLKLARLDAETIELEKDTHNVRDFLVKCISHFTTRAEQEGKSITLGCSNSMTLCFDETWLGEALGNVIKNALDHTQAGDGVKLSCEETAVATEIIVRDNGAGIHPEDIHHIFKRFFRSRYSKDKQGVGIGLALSMAIVEKHGGTITVESELEHGAEFHFIFPKLTNM